MGDSLHSLQLTELNTIQDGHLSQLTLENTKIANVLKILTLRFSVVVA